MCLCPQLQTHVHMGIGHVRVEHHMMVHNPRIYYKSRIWDMIRWVHPTSEKCTRCVPLHGSEQTIQHNYQDGDVVAVDVPGCVGGGEAVAGSTGRVGGHCLPPHLA